MFSKSGLIKNNTGQVKAADAEMDLSASAQDLALDEMSDELLMKAYAADDKLAFDKLYDRYRLPLYRYMQRQVSINEEVLNELYQDVWLKLINRRQQYQVKASFKTFLYQIAVNTIRDFFRRESVRKIVTELENQDEVRDDQPAPDKQAELEQLMQQFQRELLALPAEQREVFLLREEAGLTSVQIAEMMQLSVDTVKSRMRYAVSRLKMVLK